VASNKPETLVTPADSVALLLQIDLMLGSLNERLTDIALSGPLNPEQHGHFTLARLIVTGLRRRFDAERERLARMATLASSSLQTKES
jgi:hypothetical protein